MNKISRRTLNILREKSHVCINKTIVTPHSFELSAYYSRDSERKVKNIKDRNRQKSLAEIKVKGKKTKTQTWKSITQKLAYFGASVTCIGVYLISFLGSAERDEDEKPIRDDLSNRNIINQYILRAYRELVYYSSLIKGPLNEKLLPDHLAYPYMQPKYTLVLELTDVLVHTQWSYTEGWRFKKLDALDPKNIIAYKLVRGTTHFEGGNHVKKLNNLNRDLSKVICIDWNDKNVKYNPENLFNIKRWDGNDDDTSLLDLTTFLKTIADSDIADVRDVLKYYSKYPDPIAAFREKQERLIEELERQAAARRAKVPSNMSRLLIF
ncbi:hypothetical protein NQ314_019636 [Rhamnusium bicolor]|uniref:Mitochondrial import inner membrane translocase subunit TIM50 n=1 Tax=Rhamnusium bicolor TaxID=1586634 RepID=A0AAV8WNC2_9CUCU|nr:hypothetical protein NQ314_019636 [Rhamnusium bicolor]